MGSRPHINTGYGQQLRQPLQSQGKLDEAEKMYQRALQGYEKALGSVLIITYVPALNTAQNLAMLLSQIVEWVKLKELYCALNVVLKQFLDIRVDGARNIAVALAGLGI